MSHTTTSVLHVAYNFPFNLSGNTIYTVRYVAYKWSIKYCVSLRVPHVFVNPSRTKILSLFLKSCMSRNVILRASLVIHTILNNQWLCAIKDNQSIIDSWPFLMIYQQIFPRCDRLFYGSRFSFTIMNPWFITPSSSTMSCKEILTNNWFPLVFFWANWFPLVMFCVYLFLFYSVAILWYFNILLYIVIYKFVECLIYEVHYRLPKIVWPKAVKDKKNSTDEGNTIYYIFI